MADYSQCPICNKPLYGSTTCPDCYPKWLKSFKECSLPPGLEGYTQEEFTYHDYEQFWKCKNDYERNERFAQDAGKPNTDYTLDMMIADMQAVIKDVIQRKVNKMRKPKQSPKVSNLSQKEVYKLLIDARED